MVVEVPPCLSDCRLPLAPVPHSRAGTGTVSKTGALGDGLS